MKQDNLLKNTIATDGAININLAWLSDWTVTKDDEETYNAVRLIKKIVKWNLSLFFSLHLPQKCLSQLNFTTKPNFYVCLNESLAEYVLEIPVLFLTLKNCLQIKAYPMVQ